MAESETFAHLEHLVLAGQAERYRERRQPDLHGRPVGLTGLRVSRMPTRADDPTAEATDLLRDLIRNQCVNDGRVESGEEIRSVDLLGSYLEGAGLDMERYEPQPGRSSLVARIEGTDPDAPVPAPDGPHRRRAREPRRVEPRPVRRRDRRRVRLGPRRGRHAQRHRHDGGRVPPARRLRLQAEGHAHLPRGRRRGGAGHVGRQVARRERARRRVRRLRAHRVGRVPDPDAGGRPPARAWSTRRARTGRSSPCAGRPATRRSRSAPTTRVVTAAEVVRRLAEYQPPTQIHDTWRRLRRGHAATRPEFRDALLDADELRRLRRSCRSGCRGVVLLVHAHDVRADRRRTAAPRPTSSPTASTSRSTSARCPGRPATTSHHHAARGARRSLRRGRDRVRTTTRRPLADRHARCGTRWRA